MRLVILLFLCAHSHDAVAVRTKPVRIISYRKNQTTAAGTVAGGTATSFAARMAAAPPIAAATRRKNASIGRAIVSNVGVQYLTSDPASKTTTGTTDRPKITVTTSAASTISAATIRFTTAAAETPTNLVDVNTSGAKPVATNAAKATISAAATIGAAKIQAPTVTIKTWPDYSAAAKSAKTKAGATTTTIAHPMHTSGTSQTPMAAAENITDRSGYLSVHPRTHLFYWFFRSQSKPTDPLVVWLQGQPNASSLYGAFDETGPFYIDGRNKSLGKREHSWTSSFHVLYLDPHPGCGFSHAEDPAAYALDYDRVAKTITRALRHFYAMYPQLVANDLYLAAQSVGAKYAIVVAHGILHGAVGAAHRGPNLKGVLLGNAVIDEYQLANYHFGMLAFGLVDMKMMKAVAAHEDQIATLIRARQFGRAAQYWHQHIFAVYTRVGYHSPYDVRSVNAFWDSLVVNYTNQANVRKELGVGDAEFKPAAQVYVTSESLRPIPNLMRELLRNIKVLLYHGQYDMFAPYTHSTEFLNKLNWPENLDFYTSQRHNWYIGKRLVGYWSNSQNLSLLLIRNAGHMVGSTQPECMLQMLNDFTNAKFEGSIQFV